MMRSARRPALPMKEELAKLSRAQYAPELPKRKEWNERHQRHHDTSEKFVKVAAGKLRQGTGQGPSMQDRPDKVLED